ncbi:hypothetical protein SLA2020_446790 [Shorea laevis]
MISETHLLFVGLHMCQFTEDRRMSLARTVVPGLCQARKGSYVLFVILQLLGQMLLGCSVLLLRYDDQDIGPGAFFNLFFNILLAAKATMLVDSYLQVKGKKS